MRFKGIAKLSKGCVLGCDQVLDFMGGCYKGFSLFGSKQKIEKSIKLIWKSVGAVILLIYLSLEFPKLAEGLNNRLENYREALEENGIRTCGKTMLDMILNGVYKAELEVESIINNVREGQLRWFGHVRRRPQSAPIRRVEALVVDGLKRRGRPKLKWVHKVKLDMKELLLSEDMTSDRNE
uniref:Putative cytochrome P450 n=1 Tax=Tanacetum cinerariifolium TaxID=118510 RepID=A0A6L2K9G8_TANCI|nr:putative cytochrome P450 [Tanacetum cinerariifolium]